MTPIQQARQEWEANTIPCPKNHILQPVVGNNPRVHRQDFRKYGQAIAWLNWYEKTIEITKFEKLPDADRGAGTPLIEFLKSLADKYQIRIFGGVVAYDLDEVPKHPSLLQNQLETWYKKRSFRLHKSIKSGTVEAWYPDAPPTGSS